MYLAAAPPYLPALWRWRFWTYDGDGNVTSSTDALGATTTISYDTTFNLYPVLQCNELDHCTSFTWDSVIGRRTSETDANGQTIQYAFDSFGREFWIYTPGSYVEYEYLNFGNPQLQRTRKWEDGLWTDVYQDGLGRTRSTVRQGGFTKLTIYQNTLTRPWKESLWFGPGETPRYIEYTYDASGRPRIARNPDNTESETQYGLGFRDVFDELDHKRRIWTDGLGRITQVREWDDSGNPLDTTYSYDVIDRMIQSVDHMGKVSTHTWMLVGQKICKRSA